MLLLFDSSSTGSQHVQRKFPTYSYSISALLAFSRPVIQSPCMLSSVIAA
jgi:hypothetical protein